MKFFYRFLYRPIMRLAHHFNWHYAPPIYPEETRSFGVHGAVFAMTIKRGNGKSMRHEEEARRLGVYPPHEGGV